MKDAIRAYYAGFADREWLRLTRPSDGALEFALTCQVLNQYLPPHARVLDIGGGPGRYTIWLAQQGHRVVLADLSPELIDIARVQIAAAGVADQVEELVVADACDLARWTDTSFDAVVSLGPFYHLPDGADRARAAQELVRVLRPDGVAFVALIPRYAFIRRTLALIDERPHLARPDWLNQLLTFGVFENDRAGRFTGGYGVRPEEVAPFFAQYGCAPRALVSTEGIVPDLQDAFAELATTDPAAFEAAFDVVMRTAGDPSILGLASHLLYVGQKERLDARW